MPSPTPTDLKNALFDLKVSELPPTGMNLDTVSALLSLLLQNGINGTAVTVAFSASTISATFTIANKLAMIVCPAITGAPTLTLQVSLDAATWVNTSVNLATSASLPTLLEADSLAKLTGAFGLPNAFRFSSSAPITATLNMRSVTQ